MRTYLQSKLVGRLLGIAFLATTLLGTSAAVSYAGNAASWIAGGVGAIIAADLLTRHHHPSQKYYQPPDPTSYRTSSYPGNYAPPPYESGPVPAPAAWKAPVPPGAYSGYAPRPEPVVIERGVRYDSDPPVPAEVRSQRLRTFLNQWVRDHPDNGTQAWQREYGKFVTYQQALFRENDYRLRTGAEPPFRGQDYNGYGHWGGGFHDGFDYQGVYGPDWQRMLAYAHRN